MSEPIVRKKSNKKSAVEGKQQPMKVVADANQIDMMLKLLQSMQSTMEKQQKQINLLQQKFVVPKRRKSLSEEEDDSGAEFSQSDEEEDVIETNSDSEEETGSGKPVKVDRPEPFAGSKDQKIDAWLNKWNLYFHCTKVQKNKMVPIAALRLEKRASTWWLYYCNEYGIPKKWKEFCKAMQTEFKPTNTKQLARDKLAECKQTKSILDYTDRFRDICREIPGMNEEEKLDKFMRGLREETHIQVALREPKSVHEAMKFAR